MCAETTPNPSVLKVKTVYRNTPASNAVYGLGLIGAWVYYFSQAKSLLDGVLAFFQGLVWPAFVIYDLLKYLNPS